MSFNLTEESWIPVVTHEWKREEISLVELFKSWGSLRSIQAENPPTTLALYRFLLTILHRSYQGPNDVAHWEEIQNDSGERVLTYLKEAAECFDLLHPEQPFMQDKALADVKPVSIYIVHTMSTSQVFSHEHEWSGYSITSAEAARMLVRLQFVDVTSLRAFYPPQSQGNRSAVNTPTINSAVIFLQGSSLKNSLLLNLMQYSPEKEIPKKVSGSDLPAWETGYSGKPKKQIPSGYINYLSYPWRRLYLFRAGEKFSQIAITMGNSLPEQISAQQWECAIAYQDEKPVRLSLERQLWRDSHSFLLSSDKNCRPRIIDWLADLREEDLVADDIHLQVFGMCADKAKPLGWSVELFSVPTVYIKDRELAGLLKLAVTTAEEHRQVFRSFRGSPYQVLAEVLKYNEVADLASSLDGESRYWATLDQKFSAFIHDLPSDNEVDQDGVTLYGSKLFPEWVATVQQAAMDAFTSSISPIRNYKARASALRALAYWLHKLRGVTPEQTA